ncbi:putative glycerol-1-phosphate prenyltransferase [Salsuginibacillus halophilus]|uniref:Heptaprenylglyceryl phosphate synthase n=1 Tax=Salsuginibacillus halophilus TaxID=517424 RepID=A0A2P8HLE8_9BACI|nr:heptaprenylglyceryl phosphate synthase [Salsuginibacillus halophilus]PSL47052.1 putative glycerol-1-phosphate prenyltransferase [Salsuginibacillus halophilus]
MIDMSTWRHVFKLDPAKTLNEAELEAVCESGTDAVIIGGSDNVTLDDTLRLLASVRRYAVPCVCEVSNPEAVTPGFDAYFIPSVLNAKDPMWITGMHQQALKAFGPLMDHEEVVGEGYCILNPEAKAAMLTGAKTDQTAEDVEAYARLAEKVFRLPLFYVEYSGMYGETEVVQAAKRGLEKTQLFYGGGITNEAEAKEMSGIADTIVVGNALYDNFREAIATVNAVKAQS